MTKPPSRIDQTLTLVVLALLLVGVFLVLQPFITAIVWAAILTATLWPLFLWLRDRLGGRPTLAALLLVTLIALTVLTPFVIVGATIAENADRVAEWIRMLVAQGPPEPPAWVAQLPYIGERASAYWGGFANDTAKVMDELRKLAEPARKYAVSGGASVLGALLQLALSILIAFFFFHDGEVLVSRLFGAAGRIAGERGQHLARVAGITVRGVVLGILGTALVQGVLAAVGFAIAGIKAAPLLGFITFFLSPVPIGPPLVWIPAGVWLISQGDTGWGIFVLAWGTLVVSTVDNVIKPLIISRGSDLPFILVLMGVLGGAVAFGFIGVFLGPVLLAVGYALLKEWAVSAPVTPAASAPPPNDTDAA
ncbi:MAG: AI-2E family transporter [Betaproteobacteria bacterium]